MSKQLRYDGSTHGNPCCNTAGRWCIAGLENATDQNVRPIGDAEGEVSERLARSLAAGGGFQIVDVEDEATTQPIAEVTTTETQSAEAETSAEATDQPTVEPLESMPVSSTIGTAMAATDPTSPSTGEAFPIERMGIVSSSSTTNEREEE